MKLKIAQVIGLNTDQKAAQVISSPGGLENTFFAVLDLSSDDAFTRGRQLLQELSDFYLDFEGSPSEKLNATFDAAKKKLPQEDPPVGGQDFSILLAAVSGKILYLISKGDLEVYLKRDGKLSALLSVGAPSQLISGFLEEGDKLFLSTKSLINFLGEDLEKSLDLPSDAFEQEITGRIGTSDLENQSLAALAIEVEMEQADPEKQAIPPLEEEESDNVGGFINVLVSIGSKAKELLITYFPKSGRGRLILAVILILIIASGVFFKVKAAKDTQLQASFSGYLQGAKDDFNAAKGLASLNPAEAKGKLDSSKDKLNKALALRSNNSEAQGLKKQIEDELGSILKQSSVADFPLFLDMDLVKKNFRASQMSYSSGKLLLMDQGVKTLVLVDLAKKSNQILAGSEQLGDASFASLNGNMAFVYSKDKGLLRIDSTNQKLTTVSKKDSEWSQVLDIYGFASNVYILDSAKFMIWKYLPTSEGYSDKREYLTKNTKADLTNALRMQIESSVYVLKKGGEILRFTRGDKDNFGLEGLDKGVKDPKSFFVSSDSDNLYVLDSGNSRLLILSKIGSYKGQMSGSEFGKASDLVVDEKAKLVYLLDGGKIFQVDLK